MKKQIYYLIFFLSINLLCYDKSHAQTPYPASTQIKDVLGIIHMNGKYHFDPSKDFMKEGVDEIQAMGTRVIKLFMGRSSASSYPSYWGNNWPAFTNLTALAQTSYFQDAFSRPQFKTYILTTYEMTNGGNVTYFQDGISTTEETNLYNEIYNLTTYLCNTYANTGKTFVLANWEGDGMLGFVNENPLPSVAVQDARINGLTRWFQIRQNAITDARNAANKPGVMVVGAAEFNHVSIRKTYPWPTMIDRIVPNLNMDLYSFSNWKTNIVGYEDDFNETLQYIKDKCPSSALYGANDIYIGETGTYELKNVTGGPIPEHTEYSDRLCRQIMQRNTELALKFGVRYILHWDIYDNGLRDGVTLPPGQNATEAQGVGVGIRRADGSYSGTYTYYKAIMNTTLGDYLHVYEAEAQGTTTSSGDTNADYLIGGASGGFISKLSADAVNDYIQYTLKQTQKQSCYVKVKYRTGPSYGKFKLSIGSQTLPNVVDCYNATNSLSEVTLGPFYFSNLPGTISYNYKFTVQGKTGSGYDLGIDAITVEPLDNSPYFNSVSAINNQNNYLVPFKIEDNNSIFDNFSCYPNPTVDKLSVDFNKSYNLAIYNLAGQKVLEKPIFFGRQEINVSSLQRGVYILKASTHGKTVTKKIWLQ